STSKYLESRLEEFAREIIDKTQIPDNVVKVQLTGHTDIIGTQTYNLKLSQLRAEKELRYLRDLMKFLLNLDTDFELDQWMKENNLTLTAVGKGESEPYYIERYRNGKFEKVLVGDNSLPEGRSVNRRVVIDVSEMIKK
ncbi:MAG TPA: OmpA family protein, partial [candidate division Zixibacteria bacterium]|nr:OmpA family protein [candidate division Zixibacteria bacterium]